MHIRGILSQGHIHLKISVYHAGLLANLYLALISTAPHKVICYLCLSLNQTPISLNTLKIRPELTYNHIQAQTCC